MAALLFGASPCSCSSCKEMVGELLRLSELLHEAAACVTLPDLSREAFQLRRRECAIIWEQIETLRKSLDEQRAAHRTLPRGSA